MPVIRSRIGKTSKSKTPKPQLRRSTRIQLNKEQCTITTPPVVIIVINAPNAISGPIDLPIEIFHVIMDHLDVGSMLSVYHTCRDFRRKLHYELANYVWYKRLPPAILTQAERGRGRIDRDHISCLGAKYTNLFNYCNEVEYYLSEDHRCENCFLRDSPQSPPRSKQWGRMLCALCVNLLGISRAELKHLLFQQMTMAPFRKLRAVTPQKLLYRPSVDTIVRQYTGRGLSDFELADKDEWRMRTEDVYQNHPLHDQHQFLRQRLIDTTQYLYTYLSTICCRKSGEISAAEAKKPFQLLCDQLQMDERELNSYMSAWLNTTGTLDSAIIYILVSRIGLNIIPYLFPDPFSGTDSPLSTPVATVDKFIKEGFTNNTLDFLFRNEDPPEVYIIFDSLRLVVNLLDINATDYNRYLHRGARPLWIETMKRYHRANIHKDLLSGAIINMTHPNAHPNIYNKRGNPTNRGIISLRQKLGLAAFPPHKFDYMRTDPNDKTANVYNPAVVHPDMSDEEKEAAATHALAAAQQKEKEVLPYFNKLCVEACMRCPVTGDQLPRTGLEEMLEHVRIMHRDVFWYRDISLLG